MPGDAALAEWRVWRSARLERLAAPDGWLSLVGLYWLRPGVQQFGSGPESELRLDHPALPAVAGSFVLADGRVSFSPAPDAPVMHAGRPLTGSLSLRPAGAGEPTVLEVGTLRFYLIERDGRMGLRVKDRQAPARRHFAGLDYFAYDPRFRVEARFEPRDPPRRIPVLNVVGMKVDMLSPGSLVFELNGREHRLDPVLESPGADRLFIMFADRTSGRETYGAGRYLYAPLPDEEGRVVLDFNRAYNPPCVFTDFATCPLPPLQNRLELAVTAGEKMYEGAH